MSPLSVPKPLSPAAAPPAAKTPALRPGARRTAARTAALAALTLGGVLVTGAPAAVSAPNADVLIHEVGTPFDATTSAGKVCDFYLSAIAFDPAERVRWKIVPDPASQGPYDRAGSVEANASGQGVTTPLALPNGRYKLTWTANKTSPAGSRTFRVHCDRYKPKPNHPHGGPPAGGGALARDEAFGPVAGAAAVGTAAVGGAVWLRLRRRRTHGA